jgi:signal transduction histidine kinase
MASRAETEAANRAKDEFLAVLGHELRTPLAAISQSAETQSRLIDDLLDLSRLTTGKLRLSPTSFDVTRVVEEAVETVRHAAIARGIALTTEIDDGVGAAVLDGTRLKQVLWNLLTNAVKFTPAGGEVTVRARRSEGQLEIEVSDDGEGIAPESFPHRFEKFRQADMGEARPHMGLGIGLSLSKQLVELHGGAIEAASEGRGRGATFRVRVPCDEASAPSSATGAARAGSTERPSLAGLRLGRPRARRDRP